MFSLLPPAFYWPSQSNLATDLAYLGTPNLAPIISNLYLKSIWHSSCQVTQSGDHPIWQYKRQGHKPEEPPKATAKPIWKSNQSGNHYQSGNLAPCCNLNRRSLEVRPSQTWQSGIQGNLAIDCNKKQCGKRPNLEKTPKDIQSGNGTNLTAPKQNTQSGNLADETNFQSGFRCNL